MCSRIVLSCVALLAVACGSADQQQQRPAGVPAEAVFVGGADGGAYVVIRHVQGDVYQLDVFLDSGVSAYRGKARASAFPAVPITADDVLGWDGENLVLEGGGALVPMEPVQPVEVDVASR